MASIHDWVLTLCPKMRCVPDTKETESLDACIKQSIKSEKDRSYPWNANAIYLSSPPFKSRILTLIRPIYFGLSVTVLTEFH